MPIRRATATLLLLAASTTTSLQERPAAQQQLAAIATCTPQTIGPAILDIRSVAIEPRFLLNGRPFPGAEAGLAVFTLWASDPIEHFDGPQLILGESNLPAHTVRVVPGVYDVYYSWIAGAGVPRNEWTRLMHRVTLDADRALVVNVPMIHIGGLKQHNGHEFGYEGVATLSLRGLDWPGTVPLGAVQPAEFEQAIIPGRYALEYNWQQGVNFPNNQHAVVRRLDLSASADDLTLNVRSVIQPFQFLHNGAPFPNTLFEYGDLVLRRGEREEVPIGPSHEPGPVVRVIPGSYDVHWRHVAGANVPANSDARIQRRLRVDGELRVIDVPSLEVSGTFLVNGVPTPNSEFENARIILSGASAGDGLVLGQTRYGGYLKRVVPGAYDIVYEHVAGASTMPTNPRATLARGWRVEESPERTIDIPVGVYRGSFLLNGSEFGGGEFRRGQIFAVPRAPDGVPASLGFTNYGGFEHRLLPGRYRAAYTHTAGSDLPENVMTLFGPARRVIAGAEVTGDLDVPAGILEFSYFHNGAPMPSGGAQNARVHLVWGAAHLQLHDSHWGPREIMAMEGRFNLYYEYRGGPDLPVNAFMPIGCWILER
jgi:hypothetical protein